MSSDTPLKIPISSDSLILPNERSNLIALMPATTKILKFDGQYLNTRSNGLSPIYVYRCTEHNGPVFDALTADPASKRLFLFQSTLQDPYYHPVSITAFNKVMSNLMIDKSFSIDEVYFYMIISAHQNHTSQHFFSFKIGCLHLSSCFLSLYASADGINTLKKAISISSGQKNKWTSVRMTPEELACFSDKEQALMMTILGCFVKEGVFNKIHLDRDLYDNLFLFLQQYASRLRPFVCRAEFNASTVFKVAEKAAEGSE